MRARSPPAAKGGKKCASTWKRVLANLPVKLLPPWPARPELYCCNKRLLSFQFRIWIPEWASRKNHLRFHPSETGNILRPGFSCMALKRFVGF